MLSSSSAKTATEQALKMSRPKLAAGGHPFNPPHLIPLVEVVPGEKTSPEAVDDAVAFYAALGKVPRVVRKELTRLRCGTACNGRFSGNAHLVIQGVVKVDELDASDVIDRSALGGGRSVPLVPSRRRRGRVQIVLQAIRSGSQRGWKEHGAGELRMRPRRKTIAQAEASFAANLPRSSKRTRCQATGYYSRAQGGEGRQIIDVAIGSSGPERTRSTGRNEMGLLFEGLKVIDCGSFIAAPAAATIFLHSRRCRQDRAAGGRGPLPAPHETSRPPEERPELCLDARFPQQAQPRGRYGQTRGQDRGPAFCLAGRCLHHHYLAAVRSLASAMVSTVGAERQADLRVVLRIWRKRRRGDQAGLRCHGNGGCVGFDGHRSRVVGVGTGATRERHGRSLCRFHARFRHRDGALSAPEHGQGNGGVVVAGPRKRTLGQRLQRASSIVRRDLH